MKVHQQRLLDKGTIEKLVDALRAGAPTLSAVALNNSGKTGHWQPNDRNHVAHVSNEVGPNSRDQKREEALGSLFLLPRQALLS